MFPVSRTIDRYETIFDHDGLIANAGLIVVATLMSRLGLERLANEWVKTGSHAPGRKLCTLIAAMLAGASHIDHTDVLRAGATQQVLGFRVMAPSTIGTFLRSFTFGFVRQLDAVAARLLANAWAAGAGPGNTDMVIDLDSTICEVHGHAKQGAGYGYTKHLGYHPLVATRAGTGEILSSRMRKGAAGSSRGINRFIDELAGILKRAKATGAKCVRADSGFWSWELLRTLDRHKMTWSITVTNHAKVKAAIATIPDDAWVDIDYTLGGYAQVAETTYVGGGQRKKHRRTVRLVVRRTRLADRAQQALFADWRHHSFITNRHDLTTIEADRFHREHAVVELAIRELKDGGATHIPSGHYAANAAWFGCAVIAHNLARLSTALGEHEPVNTHPERPDRRRSRRRRQPIRPPHPQVPDPMALARSVHHHARQPASTSRPSRLTPAPADRRAPEPDPASRTHQHPPDPPRNAPTQARPPPAPHPDPTNHRRPTKRSNGGFRLSQSCPALADMRHAAHGDGRRNRCRVRGNARATSTFDPPRSGKRAHVCRTPNRPYRSACETGVDV